MKGNNMEEKVIKEMLKRIIDNNNDIPIKAKADLKIIIDLEKDPEQLLQECLLYLLSYKM